MPVIEAPHQYQGLPDSSLPPADLWDNVPESHISHTGELTLSDLGMEQSFEVGAALVGALEDRFPKGHPILASYDTRSAVDEVVMRDLTPVEVEDINEALEHVAAKPGSPHNLMARRLLGEDITAEVANNLSELRKLPAPPHIESRSPDQRRSQLRSKFSFINSVKRLVGRETTVELRDFGDATAALRAIESVEPSEQEVQVADSVKHEVESLVQASQTHNKVFISRKARFLRRALVAAASRDSLPLDVKAAQILRRNTRPKHGARTYTHLPRFALNSSLHNIHPKR